MGGELPINWLILIAHLIYQSGDFAYKDRFIQKKSILFLLAFHKDKVQFLWCFHFLAIKALSHPASHSENPQLE